MVKILGVVGLSALSLDYTMATAEQDAPTSSATTSTNL